MWDFSKTGWQVAARSFLSSVIKTALVAVGSYAALKLANIEVDFSQTNAELFAGLVIIGRAVVSAFLVWVNTLPGDTEHRNNIA